MNFITQKKKDSKIPLYHIVLSIINNSLCFIMLVLWQLLLRLLFSHRHLDV